MVVDMEQAGLGKSDRDLMLAYLGQISHSHRPDVFKDRRNYPLSDGGWSLPRPIETWREAHRVLVKLEEAETGSKSLCGPGRAGRGRREWRAQPTQKG